MLSGHQRFTTWYVPFCVPSTIQSASSKPCREESVGIFQNSVRSSAPRNFAICWASSVYDLSVVRLSLRKSLARNLMRPVPSGKMVREADSEPLERHGDTMIRKAETVPGARGQSGSSPNEGNSREYQLPPNVLSGKLPPRKESLYVFKVAKSFFASSRLGEESGNPLNVARTASNRQS